VYFLGSVSYKAFYTLGYFTHHQSDGALLLVFGNSVPTPANTDSRLKLFWQK